MARHFKSWPRRAYLCIVAVVVAIVGVIFCVVQSPMLLGLAITQGGADGGGAGQIGTSEAETLMAAVTMSFFALGLGSGLLALSACKRGRYCAARDELPGGHPVAGQEAAARSAAGAVAGARGGSYRGARPAAQRAPGGGSAVLARSMSAGHSAPAAPPRGARIPRGDYDQLQ